MPSAPTFRILLWPTGARSAMYRSPFSATARSVAQTLAFSTGIPSASGRVDGVLLQAICLASASPARWRNSRSLYWNEVSYEEEYTVPSAPTATDHGRSLHGDPHWTLSTRWNVASAPVVVICRIRPLS